MMVETKVTMMNKRKQQWEIIISVQIEVTARLIEELEVSEVWKGL